MNNIIPSTLVNIEVADDPSLEKLPNQLPNLKYITMRNINNL